MQALEELPNHDKDMLMPFIPLGPWTTAQNFTSSLSRLKEAYGERPCFVKIAEPELGGGERSVHATLAALRNPTDGYRAWCEFIETQNNFVPNLQLSELSELMRQTSYLYGLGRGMIVAFDDRQFVGIDFISQQVGQLTHNGRDICFFIDFGKCRDAISISGKAIEYAELILRNAPNSFVSISASSFPATFGDKVQQEIFERTLFGLVSARVKSNLIYSDRGSARAERQIGGGGTIPPRVDYAAKEEWFFFRSDISASNAKERDMAYFEQAKAAIAAPSWDAKLHIWGTQMIERTAIGDTSAITSPKRNTAARINIHLHRQLFYSDPTGMYDTDDEWTD
jgi:hypothetical protein